MKFYRFEDVLYASMCDAWGGYQDTDELKVECYSYDLIKETPKGYWIGKFGLFKKWVSKTSKKRFAYPSESEARHAFICRKTRQIEILESKLKRAQTALRIANENTLLTQKRRC